MLRTRGMRYAVALALAAALAAPVYAAGEGGGRDSARAWSWPGVSRVWAWLVQAVLPDTETDQSDCGIHIDPNGRCETPQALPPEPEKLQSDCDRGSQIDPNGGCGS